MPRTMSLILSLSKDARRHCSLRYGSGFGESLSVRR